MYVKFKKKKVVFKKLKIVMGFGLLLRRFKTRGQIRYPHVEISSTVRKPKCLVEGGRRPTSLKNPS